MKNKLIVFLMISCSLFSLFSSGANESEKPEKLTVWHGYSQTSRIDAMNAIGQKYTEKTGIPVEFEVVTWPNQAEKWRAAYAAGTMPDVMICLPDQATAMYFAGATVPADDAIKLIGGADRFLPGTLKEQFYDGHYIGVPHYAHSRLLIYRKDILEQHGLNPPKTWEEYLNVCKEINDPPHYAFQQLFNKSDYGSAFMLDVFMRNEGGKFFDENFNIVFDSPETIRAVQFLVDLYHIGSMPEAMNYIINDQFTLLNTGATYMTIDSAFTINSALENAPDIAAVMDVAEPPYDSYYLTTFPIVVGNTSNIDIANDFIAFMFEEENYVNFLHAILPGMNPVLKDIEDKTSSYWENPAFSNPLVGKCVDLQAKGLVDGWSIGFEYGVNPFASVCTAGYVEEMFQKIIIDNVPIEQAVAECAVKMQQAVDEQKEALGWE